MSKLIPIKIKNSWMHKNLSLNKKFYWQFLRLTEETKFFLILYFKENATLIKFSLKSRGSFITKKQKKK